MSFPIRRVLFDSPIAPNITFPDELTPMDTQSHVSDDFGSDIEIFSSAPQGSLWATGNDSSEGEIEEMDTTNEPKTPPSKPISGLPCTPASTIMDIFTTNAGYTLTPTTREKLKKTCEALDQLPDTPIKQLKSRKTAKIIAQLLPEQDPRKPETHKTISEFFNSPVHWEWSTISQVLTIHHNTQHKTETVRPPSSIVNLNHIVSGECSDQEKEKGKGKGLHCIKSEYETTPKIIHPKTGISAYSWRQKENQEFKFSTFFPEHLRTEEEFLQYFNTLSSYAIAPNRELFVEDEFKDHNIWVEAFVRYKSEHGFPIKWIYSAFPLFHVETFEKDKTFTIHENCSISSQDILTIASELLLEQEAIHSIDPSLCPIRYFNADTMLIDIARPFFDKKSYIPTYLEDKLKVEKGVCFWFPCSVFPQSIQFIERVKSCYIPSSSPNAVEWLMP